MGYVPPTVPAPDGLGPRIDVYEMVNSTGVGIYYHRSVGRLEISLELGLRDLICGCDLGEGSAWEHSEIQNSPSMATQALYLASPGPKERKPIYSYVPRERERLCRAVVLKLAYVRIPQIFC